MFVLQTLMFYRSIFGFQGTLTSGLDFHSHRGIHVLRTFHHGHFSNALTKTISTVLRKASFPLSGRACFCAIARILATVEVRGFEPLTPCLQGRCSPS